VDELEPPHPNGAVHANGSAPPKRRHAPWEFMILALLVALVGIGIILGWTLVGHRSPERLTNANAQTLSSACNDAQAALKQLPNPSPVNGGDVVARIRAEDVVLRTMVSRLSTVTPSASTPAAALRAWTEDWSRVIDARERFATALAATKGTNNKVEFVLPATNGIHPVTDNMDNYVRENDPNLKACFTDALQLSTVEGPRTYAAVSGNT
jgi:hypothetical protein